MNNYISNRLRIIPVALGLLALALVGCTSVRISDGVQGEYKLGELQVYADTDFADSYEAAKSGIKDAELFLTGDDKKVIEAVLNARSSADELITVKIKEVGKNRTSIKIRYGVTGDLPSAQRLYDYIAKHL